MAALLLRKPGKGGMKQTNLTLYKVAAPFRELHRLQQATTHTLHRVERDSDKGQMKRRLRILYLLSLSPALEVGHLSSK